MTYGSTTDVNTKTAFVLSISDVRIGSILDRNSELGRVLHHTVDIKCENPLWTSLLFYQHWENQFKV